MNLGLGFHMLVSTEGKNVDEEQHSKRSGLAELACYILRISATNFVFLWSCGLWYVLAFVHTERPSLKKYVQTSPLVLLNKEVPTLNDLFTNTDSPAYCAFNIMEIKLNILIHQPVGRSTVDLII